LDVLGIRIPILYVIRHILNIIYDVVVSSVTSTTSDGTYTVGEVIPIVVTFDKTVEVTGTACP
jgi:hypothetical protein